MKIETLMWLLPVVFMFHDFEEVIMMQPWIRREAPVLKVRFPRLAGRLLPHFERLTTSSFALAVMVMFTLVSAATYISVELEQYSLWVGVLLGFFLHLIAHIIQFVVYRKYVPVVITSVLASGYCVYALVVFSRTMNVKWGEAMLWLAVSLLVIVGSVFFSHRLAARFEEMMRKEFGA